MREQNCWQHIRESGNAETVAYATEALFILFKGQDKKRGYTAAFLRVTI